MEELDPRLKLLWEASPLELRLPTKLEATALRHRLYVARRHLELLDPTLHSRVRFYSIRVKDNDLTIFDPNTSLDEAIAAAGLGQPEPPPLDDDMSSEALTKK